MNSLQNKWSISPIDPYVFSPLLFQMFLVQHLTNFYIISDESGTAPSWNFFKYLVNEHGEVVDSWGPWTSVDEIYPIVQEAVTNMLKRRHTEL